MAADPLSVAGTAVGIISLGIQVTQYLYDYYKAIKNQHDDMRHTTRKLDSLLGILEHLNRQIRSRTFLPDEQDLLREIESAIEQCGECVQDLQVEAKKFEQKPGDGFRATARAAARRVAYPIRQSTLQKLDEDIDETVAQLSLALQLLQQDDVNHVHVEIQDTKAILGLVRTTQISLSIREWLKAPDASVDFNDACQKTHPGTGLWFVKGPSFTAWLGTPRSFLWLKGFAGCGKSVLCSTAIQYAFQHRRPNLQIGLAFFFFTFNDEKKQDASAMLRSLVLQLSTQLGGDHTVLSQLHASHQNATPPDQALLGCLHQLIRAFRDVYILVDALDESPREKHRETVLQVLQDIRAWGDGGLHVLVTSRDEVDIREELSATPEEIVEMRNEEVDNDIASYVSQHLRENRRLRKLKDYHDQIEEVLSERAQGV
jgi:archaellum biogenesis ATPase FlaH